MLIGFQDMQKNMFSCITRRFLAPPKHIKSLWMASHHEVKAAHLSHYNFISSIAHFTWLAHHYTLCLMQGLYSFSLKKWNISLNRKRVSWDHRVQGLGSNTQCSCYSILVCLPRLLYNVTHVGEIASCPGLEFIGVTSYFNPRPAGVFGWTRPAGGGADSAPV